MEALLLKRVVASALGRWLTPTPPGEFSEPREPPLEPNCGKPETWVRTDSGLGYWGQGAARVQGSPGGTGKAVAAQVHKSEQGGGAAGAVADAPREGATAQPAGRTVGAPPQLHSHPLEAEGAPGQE